MIKLIEAHNIEFDKEIDSLWGQMQKTRSKLHSIGFDDLNINMNAAGPKPRQQLWLNSMQARGEILAILNLLKGSNNVLEIGTGWGCSHFMFKQVAKRVISVDIKFRLLATSALSMKALNILEGSDFVLGDSNNIATFKEVEKLLKGEKLDGIFIDGNHTYEVAKKDYELYFSLVKKGGIIAFHDFFHEKGVRQLVEEIAEKRQVYVAVDKRGPLGIAWIYKRKDNIKPPYVMRDIIPSDSFTYVPRGIKKVIAELVEEQKFTKGLKVNIHNDDRYLYLLENIHDLYLFGTGDTATKTVNKYGNRCLVMGDKEAEANIENNELDFVILDTPSNFENDIEIWFPKIRKKGWMFGYGYEQPGIKNQLQNRFHNDIEFRAGCNLWIVRKT